MVRFQFGGLEFLWSVRKAMLNVRKHHVSFEEAATVFVDPLAHIHDDPDHSASEDRFLLVGYSLGGRLLLVVCVEKGDTIRIISARCATARERKGYESNA